MRCEDARELITGLVDDQLPAEERGPLEAHLEECAGCRRQREWELMLERCVKAASEGIQAPPALRNKILAAAGVTAPADRGGVSTKLLDWLRAPGARPAFAAALLILIIVPIVYLSWPARDLVRETFAVHREAAAAQEYKSLDPITDMAPLKARLVAAVGGRFEPMGFDLSMKQLYPVAGFVRRIDDRDVIVTVYRGKGPGVTCFTFLGTEADAPSDAQLFHDSAKDINFYSFSNDGLHGVLHREGNVLCVMISQMPAGELLALMRAKARQA